MNDYLIPANSKRGQLIFNIFRPVDLVIFLIGVILTFLLLMIVQDGSTWGMILKLVPAMISALLIMPMPNQHNVLVFLSAILKYFTSQQKYKWKGWSIYESFK